MKVIRVLVYDGAPMRVIDTVERSHVKSEPRDFGDLTIKELAVLSPDDPYIADVLKRTVDEITRIMEE